MKTARLLLLPFSLLYGLITSIRNFLYDKGILKSVTFTTPVIAVGNLSTGGTGKSPQIEYLIRLLAERYRVATLSRGYKRKSKGFVLADESSNVATLGDEPFQFYSKFPEITVAVDADRISGINNLLSHKPKPQVILLDDAYQHRRVKAGFYILLTAYGDLYSLDFILPAGNLRESRVGAKRANCIIVTKCPPDLSEAEQDRIRQQLRPNANQEVYFTAIGYDEYVYSETGKLNREEIDETQKVLVAGIAMPEPFFQYLKNSGDMCKTYPDHHDFTNNETEELKNLAAERIIVTTEKDYMRLKGRLPGDRLFYLPIQSIFINDGDKFNATILNYVGENK